MRAPLLMLLVAALLAAAGCRGDAPRDAPPAEPTVTAQTPAARADLSAEDRAFVDRVVALATGHDWAGIEGLTAYTPVACIGEPSALEAPAPRCNPDEPAGTVVEAFRVGVCAGGYIRRDAGRSLIQPSGGLNVDFRFMGVVAAPGASFEVPSDFAIVFAYPDRAHPTTDGGTVIGGGDGFYYAVRDRRIVGSFRSCGSLENNLGRNPVYLLAP